MSGCIYFPPHLDPLPQSRIANFCPPDSLVAPQLHYAARWRAGICELGLKLPWWTMHMKNRSHVVGWELVSIFVSILALRSSWLGRGNLKRAGTTAGLLRLLTPGVVLCLLALRAINTAK
jgi:hypothetical protein